MGGTRIVEKAPTKEELIRKLNEHKRRGYAVGLTDERAKHIEYDEDGKMWRGYLWLHS